MSNVRAGGGGDDGSFAKFAAIKGSGLMIKGAGKGFEKLAKSYGADKHGLSLLKKTYGLAGLALSATTVETTTDQAGVIVDSLSLGILGRGVARIAGPFGSGYNAATIALPILDQAAVSYLDHFEPGPVSGRERVDEKLLMIRDFFQW